jgi:hypothetical protein
MLRFSANASWHRSQLRMSGQLIGWCSGRGTCFSRGCCFFRFVFVLIVVPFQGKPVPFTPRRVVVSIPLGRELSRVIPAVSSSYTVPLVANPWR